MLASNVVGESQGITMDLNSEAYLSVDGKHTTPVMKLKGRLSQEIIEKLRNEILETLRDAERLTIDLGGVESLDVPCLHLLCATKRYTDSMGQALNLEGVNNLAIIHLLTQYNFGSKSYCRSKCNGRCLWEDLTPGLENQGISGKKGDLS